MSVTTKQGIGYSMGVTGNGRLFMSGGVATFGGTDGALFSAPPPAVDYGTTPWSRWGDDNLLPLEMANHIENCGILGAGLEAKARIAIGKGFQPFLKYGQGADGKEELEWCDDTEIHDWFEDNNSFDYAFHAIRDNSSYGWNVSRIMRNKGKDYINKLRRLDVMTARLQKKDRYGGINSIYTHSDWSAAPTSFDRDKMAQIAALEEGNEYRDLLERNNGYEFAVLTRSSRDGRAFYPIPLWWAARAWVKIARSVPNFKNAMFHNSITLKYVISISEKYWQAQYGADWDSYDADKREELINAKYDEIDKWLTGEEAAFKSLSSGSYYDTVNQIEIPFITITVIDDKVKDGKFIPDSSAANSEILFALMMNPALVGAGSYGGDSIGSNAGGSNVRESYLVQLMISEMERQNVSNVYNFVARYNGWTKRLAKPRTVHTSTATANTATLAAKSQTPRLVFRTTSTMLTTLDTGKSTKSENL